MLELSSTGSSGTTFAEDGLLHPAGQSLIDFESASDLPDSELAQFLGGQHPEGMQPLAEPTLIRHWVVEEDLQGCSLHLAGLMEGSPACESIAWNPELRPSQQQQYAIADMEHNVYLVDGHHHCQLGKWASSQLFLKQAFVADRRLPQQKSWSF